MAIFCCLYKMISKSKICSIAFASALMLCEDILPRSYTQNEFLIPGPPFVSYMSRIVFQRASTCGLGNFLHSTGALPVKCITCFFRGKKWPSFISSHFNHEFSHFSLTCHWLIAKDILGYLYHIRIAPYLKIKYTNTNVMDLECLVIIVEEPQDAL